MYSKGRVSSVIYLSSFGQGDREVDIIGAVLLVALPEYFTAADNKDTVTGGIISVPAHDYIISPGQRFSIANIIEIMT